ncbi:MAG: deoxyribodipyrimidine photo-lyase [Thermoplasmatota archaeon]|jgi:deoxyribodipyrimidine photo-lyase
MIQKERIKYLNKKNFQNKKYIIYWMQQSQRAHYNHALEYAISHSNKYEKPLIVYFGLTNNYPEANIRHYKFMLEGLKEVKKSLEERGIRFILKQISPDLGLIDISKNSCEVIVDRGYLKIQRKWRKKVADKIKCRLIQIESDVVVPVEIASNKEEYAAYTIRNKINEKLNNFLTHIELEKYNQKFIENDFNSIDFRKISLNKFNRSVQPVENFIGGTSKAIKYLNLFLKEKINDYPGKRNNPNFDFSSNLSPYLHFGQISPIYIALSVLKNNSPGNKSFLEELIVRRELSINYVYYNLKYDDFNSLPLWAINSLKKHEKDKREYIYSLEEFENAETHDPYWNAAQKQMIKTGKMHGYMRMYWGKKIIEWSKKPKDAFKIALYLNNKYELDGRDVNSYAGIAWCFGKHDRPWRQRPIFGKIRYMSSSGLKRKFDIDLYSKKYN